MARRGRSAAFRHGGVTDIREGNVVLLIDTPEQAYLAALRRREREAGVEDERPVGFLGSYTTRLSYEPAGKPAQIVVTGAVEMTGYQAKTGSDCGGLEA